MPDPKSAWRPTLRLSIRIIMAALILFAAALITYNSYFSSRNTLINFSHQIIEQNASMVQLQVDSFIEPARRASELTLMLVNDGLIAVDNDEQIEQFFFNFISVNDSVATLNYGNVRGEFIMVKRMPDGSLSTKVVRGEGAEREVIWKHRLAGASREEVDRIESTPSDPYDPRVRPWYKGAKATRRLFWTDVYIFFSDGQPGITASVPRYDEDGVFTGALSVDIGLFDLSRFLDDNIRVGESGQAFILDQQKRLIATRRMDMLTLPAVDGALKTVRLRNLDESHRPEIAILSGNADFQRAFEKLFRDPEAGGAPASGKPITYQFGEVKYLATVQPIDIGGLRWLVVVLAAEDDFLGEAKKANLQNVITAAVLTLLALIIGGVVSTWIARSLQLLVDEAAGIENLEFEDHGEVSSTFLEIHRVLEAFQGMKTGLRAFGKYVPLTLVRLLLSERIEPAMGGRARELTILFADIRDFTTASEKMEVNDIAEKLGLFLTIMTDCIHANEGTVDKYIGDAVMAFWGAPREVPDHPVKACRAALQCLAEIDKIPDDQKTHTDFYTRIGIHTATVSVGNFGSRDRLNYTVIGDGVNLASRLEGVNKLFGTRILITEDTRSRLGDGFETRRLGMVAVKGRHGAVTIHELLGEKGEVGEERIAMAREYEKALDLYGACDFDKARELLEAMKKQAPEDPSIGYLLDAVNNCSSMDLAEDWDGVFTLTSK